MPACLPVSVCVCLPACLCVCVCLPACLRVCLPACLPPSLCVGVSVCVSACLPLCVTVYTTYICLFCCRALDQQRARGLTAEESEFWVENCIQLCKSTIKHRCSREPERLLVNSLLVRHALAVVRRDHGYRDGQPYVGTFDERIPEYRNAPLAVSVTDDGDDVTHTQLLGLGQDPAPEDWPVLLPSVQQAVQDYPKLWREHFSSLALEQCCITKFKRAQVRGGEIVLSEAYERITSRFSHFVVVEWEREGISIAKVKYFVKVDVAEQEGPFEGSGKPLRYPLLTCTSKAQPHKRPGMWGNASWSPSSNNSALSTLITLSMWRISELKFFGQKLLVVMKIQIMAFLMRLGVLSDIHTLPVLR